MSDKTLVIKVGGAILQQRQAISQLFEVIAQLQQQSVRIALVHGGGVMIDKMLKQAGLVSEKHSGLRITPKSHMPIISGVLAGDVNKQLVASASRAGVMAVGVALHDGQTTTCQPRDAHLGQVGVTQPNDPWLLNALLSAGCLPIVCSIGALNDGSLVNVNADDAAVVIAMLLQAELVFLTDIDGVYGADNACLRSLDHQHAQQLIAEGVICEGMVAKVNAALEAATRLRRSIAVTSWKTPQHLLQMYSGGEFGTRIIPNI
ncbi:acetylglutamate kinase [Thalassotalea ponticola]|uniref:acetylglutamate kinase n=1 Tax=Thalassotalea ponticola TaxID=1523392 RepID=UPI0025B3EC07|nr:acetylglutamate kinase [Thalassotalea ponticola]MDN3652860.1 acetylglutamate kinase [Thalassotalea ponticola]